MATDDELMAVLATALHGDDREPPADRVASLRAAATARTVSPPTVATFPSPRTSGARRLAMVAAAVAAAVVALVAGAAAFDRDEPSEADLLAGGVLEFETRLEAPEDAATAIATATGIRTGIGRIVQVRTDDLAILPAGEFYEVWFVGPGDTPEAPNRISAGTFHPDEDGRSAIDLTAAVDPARYPRLSVTAEPGDGEPRATGTEVLAADIEVLGG